MTPIAQLEDYGLSEYTINAFDDAGIVYLEQLNPMTQDQILSLPNIAIGRVEQLLSAVNSYRLGVLQIDPEREEIEKRYKETYKQKVAADERLEMSMRRSLTFGEKFVMEVFGPTLKHVE